MKAAATCPECAWVAEVAARSLDSVEQALHQLTAHLSADHDWSWESAHEAAARWAAALVDQVSKSSA